MGIDLGELIYQTNWKAAYKWKARREGNLENIFQYKKTKRDNFLRGVPNELCQIIRLQSGLCVKCKNNIRNYQHMSSAHGLEFPCYKEILAEIKEKFNTEKRIMENKAGLDSLKKLRGNYYLTTGSQSYQELLKKCTLFLDLTRSILLIIRADESPLVSYENSGIFEFLSCLYFYDLEMI